MNKSALNSSLSAADAVLSNGNAFSGQPPNSEEGHSRGEGERSPNPTDDAASSDIASNSAQSPDLANLPAGSKKISKSHVWERDPDDFYSENISCSQRLFVVEKFRGGIYDPCCGVGNIVKAARQAGNYAWGTDLKKRWAECLVEQDFLTAELDDVDNVVFNPPFKLAEKRSDFKILRRALELSRFKVVALLPHDFDASLAGARFLQSTPYYRKWMIVPRPSIPQGNLAPIDTKPQSGKNNFSFYVWMHGFEGSPTSGWLTPELLKVAKVAA